ncbi:hypothetical protein GCM10029978_068550 [Actinoallomurus acanthiterrae]
MDTDPKVLHLDPDTIGTGDPIDPSEPIYEEVSDSLPLERIQLGRIS